MKLKEILDSIMSLFKINNKTSTVYIIVDNIKVHVYFHKK